VREGGPRHRADSRPVDWAGPGPDPRLGAAAARLGRRRRRLTSMPELPEVEAVRAGAERHVLGRTIATAAVLNPRAVRRDPTGPAGFTAAMIGRTLTRAERRGKYLWFVLDDGSAPGGQPSSMGGSRPPSPLAPAPPDELPDE